MSNDLFNQYFPGQDPEEIMRLLKPIPPSSYDMQISDTTVPMGGRPESLPSQAGGVPVTPEVPEIPPAPTPPVAPVTPPVAPPVKPPVASTKSSAAPKAGSDPLDILLQSAGTSQDQDARNKMQTSERSKHLWGTIPVALGGIADAIGNAAVPYGGRGTSGAGTKAVESLEAGAKGRKTEFEENLKNNPNSQISQHYRNVLAMMMQKKPDDPKIANLSAAQIATTLPEIEKYMTKQLGMEQIKAYKESAQSAKNLALSEKEDQFNQRRWERFGTAVNPLTASSRKAVGIAATNNMRADRLLVTASKDKITSQDYNNMIADLQGIYKGGVPDEVMLKHGDYPSLQRRAGEILSYLSGNPQNINIPQLREHITGLTREIKTIDNKAINDNIGFNAVIFDELKEADPEKFQRAMEALSQTTVGVTEEPKPTIPSTATKPAAAFSTQDQEAMDWAKANPQDPRAARILKIHGM